jgi:hypothetical protein
MEMTMNDELISFSVRIPKDLHFQIKHAALLAEKSIQDLTIEALLNYLDALDNADIETPEPSEYVSDDDLAD